MAEGGSHCTNDAAVDYYGKNIATCSSDGTIQVRSIDNPSDPGVILTGHQLPVWQVAWAHPRFGSILASCSFDRRVIVWKDSGRNGQWSQIQVFEEHQGSVNSIDWAPHELGLILACGSSDSSISIFTAKQGNASAAWDKTKIGSAHEGGVTAVSWAPALAPGALVSSQPASHNTYVFKLVSCGCDNTVKVWRFSDGSWKMDCFPPLSKHSDWVRDVAWAPNIGLPRTTMASASQDGTVIIWTQDHSEAGSDQWQGRLLNDFKVPVWRVRWSSAGNVLAVTDGSNAVSLWKEVVDGKWSQVTAL
ncbi:hypothetical protein SELMODRAFT_94917 [Selaginella moellendorffii]|uniref:Uncharacterized protein n=1 Tax=Selaginella moellendorffii TaxID=88036 RepID=D8RIW2_SELML|nr:protein transport protein SEC13 homolog A [Selaginella moellendorffii]EFJ27600.1 hypothetical protein SELMODRAFT_94917 [Selaginella moellendorffii]|eukprot:XP_002971002.1 protein transport protein SEC13 homolog A [Selaginella moellendorffii]